MIPKFIFLFLFLIILTSVQMSAQTLEIYGSNETQDDLVVNLENPTLSTSNGSSGGSGNITVEVDPIWTRNFTNMQNDCPNGNYTFGIFNNGSFKCRSDLNGTGSSGLGNFTQDTADQLYWGLNQTKTGRTPLSHWNMSSYGFLDMLFIKFAGVVESNISIDSFGNLILKTLNLVVESDLIDFGTGRNTAVQWSFEVAGTDGQMTYINGSVDSPIPFFEYDQDIHTLGDLNVSGGLDATNDSIFRNNLTVLGNLTTKYYFGNGSRLTDVCLSNGTNCQSVAPSAEVDPIWRANFTNMQNDCPSGNYSFGIFNNGSFKCRSDMNGTGDGNSGGSGDFTNVAYNNMSNQFNGTQKFYGTILADGNLTVNSNLTLNNKSTIGANVTLSNLAHFESGGCSYGFPSASNFNVRCLIQTLAGTVISFGDATINSIAINMLVNSGVNGIITYTNDSNNRFTFTRSGSDIGLAYKVWYLISTPTARSGNITVDDSTSGHRITFNVNNTKILGMLNVTGNSNFSQNVSAQYFNGKSTDTKCLSTQVLLGNSSCLAVSSISDGASDGSNITQIASITMNSDSGGDGDFINPFRFNNYTSGTFNSRNNTLQGIRWFAQDGTFMVNRTGIYDIRMDELSLFDAGTTGYFVRILIDGVAIFQSEKKIYVSTGDDDSASSSGIINNVNSGSNISIILGGALGLPLCPCTHQSLNSTTLNIIGLT